MADYTQPPPQDYTQPPSQNSGGPPPQSYQQAPPPQSYQQAPPPQQPPPQTVQTTTVVVTSDQNTNNAIISALAYVFAWISALIVILTQKGNVYTLFHGWQSLILFLCWLPLLIIAIIIDAVTFVGFLVAIVYILYFAVCVVCIIFAVTKAPTGELFKLPLIGNFCERKAREGSGGAIGTTTTA